MRQPASAAERRKVQALGDRIAELSARIQAADAELLTMIREFDERGGWEGHVSCAQWLTWRVGLAPGAAREKVRVARALGDLPRLREAMERGAVSYSKVRAITRVATPNSEEVLLGAALAGTAAHVERVVRAWRHTDRGAEQAEERKRQASRALDTWVDDDGMVVVRGRLTPEVGAVLRRALEAAVEQAWSKAKPEVASDGQRAAGLDPADGGAADADERLPPIAQRRADALGMVAESALAGGLDKGTAGDRYQVVLHVDADTLTEAPGGGARAADAATARKERAADAAVAGEGDPAANAGPAPSGPQAVAGAPAAYVPAGTSPHRAACPGGGGPAASYVPAGTSGRDAPAAAAGAGEASRASAGKAARPAAASAASRRHGAFPGPAGSGGQAALDEAGGIRVSAETARRLACDAATVTMRHGPAGEVLDVGRRTRTISPALRRALAARDRHCRFPGCNATRCDAHHVRHWAHGGATALDNLVLLCRRHHRAVHEEGFRVAVDAAGEVRFVGPDGKPLPEAPPLPSFEGAPLAPLAARLEREGIEIGPHTATPAWRGEKLDLAWAMSVLWRPRGERP